MITHTHWTAKQRSKASEKRAASLFQGKRQPASGALPIASMKGDVVSDRFLIEDKTTNHASFHLKLATFLKVSNEAWKMKRRPVLRVEMQGTALYILDEQTLKELICD